MGLLKSLRARFSNRRTRKDNRDVGVIPSLSNEPKPENFISRNGSVARKSLPARARVEPHILNDAGPATPPKDDVPGSTIRLVRNGGPENETFQSQTRFPRAHATDNGKRNSTKLDSRTYWGGNPPLDPIDNAAEEELYHDPQGDTVAGPPSSAADMNNEHSIETDDQINPAYTNEELSSKATGRSLENGFHADHHPEHAASSAELSSNAVGRTLENRVNTDYHSEQAATRAELSAKAAGLNLEDSVDTNYHTTHAPAVTHETIRPETTEIVQESITREIHNHDYYRCIQPILDVEVLPERHFMKDIHGNLFEIPAPSGREILQPVVGEKYIDQVH